MREDVDYEDFITYTREDVKEAIEIAETFIEKVLDVIEKIVKDYP